MGYIGNQTSTAYSSMAKQTITGNGGAVYTLTYAVANNNEIEVFVNNVRQEPAVAYNAAGTTLTMTGNVLSTDDFYVVYQGKALQTTVPPDGSVTSAKLDPNLVLGGGSFLGDSGGGTADIFRVHETELNTSVTVAASTNALCAGPITLATGVTITVSSGATLVVA
jgi:hypothetical protein